MAGYQWFGPMEKLPNAETLDELRRDQGQQVVSIVPMVREDGEGLVYMMLTYAEPAHRILRPGVVPH